jgi:hypothetical protein
MDALMLGLIVTCCSYVGFLLGVGAVRAADSGRR